MIHRTSEDTIDSMPLNSYLYGVPTAIELLSQGEVRRKTEHKNRAVREIANFEKAFGEGE
jgi:hypothetical protein